MTRPHQFVTVWRIGCKRYRNPLTMRLYSKARGIAICDGCGNYLTPGEQFIRAVDLPKTDPAWSANIFCINCCDIEELR